MTRSPSAASSRASRNAICPWAPAIVTFTARPPSALAGDDVGIDDIAVEMRGLDRGEARLGEHLPCGLLSPHGAEAHAAVGQRNSHAMHARHGVQKRPE